MAKENDKVKDEKKQEKAEDKAEDKAEKKEHQNQQKADTIEVNPVGAQEPYPSKGEEE